MGNSVILCGRAEWDAAVAASAWPYLPLVRELERATSAIVRAAPRGWRTFTGSQERLDILCDCRRRALDLAKKMIASFEGGAVLREDQTSTSLREAWPSVRRLDKTLQKTHLWRLVSDAPGDAAARVAFNGLVAFLRRGGAPPDYPAYAWALEVSSHGEPLAWSPAPPAYSREAPPACSREALALGDPPAYSE